MKKILRKYFQLFQDSNMTWGKGKTNYVSSGAIVIGIIFSPIALVALVITTLFSPLASWLSEDSNP